MSIHFEKADQIGQAYILSSPSRDDALRAAREIAAAAVCMETRNVPCGVCRACRKAFNMVHPDIITVSRLPDKSGNLKREISVSQIREVTLDAQILPNEADRKVYIIDESELMNISAQNAALKLLEEPPSRVIFLLCVANPELLLETVRSRCAMLSIAGDENSLDEGSLKLAEEYLRAVSSGEPMQVYRWIAKNELSKIDSTNSFLDAALQKIADIICGRFPAGVLDAEEQIRLYRLLSRCSDYLKVNVNPRHIFSLLTAESVRIGEPE